MTDGGGNMSARLFKTDILFDQRLMSSCGFYDGPLNGKWSDAMDAAEDKFFAAAEQIKTEHGSFDPRTEGSIMTLMPAAQMKARLFMDAVSDLPFTYKIISGTRTYAEQDALFKIGRTVEKDRKPVTNARGGESNHNFGIAWDVGIFENGKYFEGSNKREEKAYADLAAHIKENVPEVEWGGDWTKFPDQPHYQLATGKTVAQIRALLEKGKPYV